MSPYRYLNPTGVRSGAISATRAQIQTPEDVLAWILKTKQQNDANGNVTATFVIDTTGHLWIADRHSEHVICSGGADVLSAGEITFNIANAPVSVVFVTNQSTGYCPEPESWAAVKNALSSAGIHAPEKFSVEFIFRLCNQCGATNIVKEGWFICAVCQTRLSENWNFGDTWR